MMNYDKKILEVRNQTNALPSNLTNEDCEICSLAQLDATLIPIIFSLIFILGLVGNSVVIYTVLRNKAMKSVPNILIVSMAVGDLILILISVPFTAAVYAFPHWLFGNFVCKLNAFLQTVSLGVSIFTLSVLSLEKHNAIINPFKYHRGTMFHRTVFITALVWAFATVLAIPDAISYYTFHIPDEDNSTFRSFCYPYPVSWPRWYSRFHVTFHALVYYLVPLSLIAYSYIKMAQHLLKSTHSDNLWDFQKNPNKNGNTGKLYKHNTFLDVR
ncbi:neuromedin-B receptor-like [Lingula anatina]|uniref:Neuromedin-B receptor-like n=1 Tax=Lingula anatina TaxID=7574 RepID=A0A1S3H1B7_LINAN|nr:neuromedin-B receptor-like [Lingula anatina]|eukprot:XP_013379732.2 neuromedin-B receptor-like [Lingula anatina]